MTTTTSNDPFSVLGLPREAGEAEIRARYLELVKQFPPDHAPDRFREIRAAYEATKDPLVIARRLIESPDPEQEPPSWEAEIESQAEIPPKLSVGFLLSLGNRGPDAAADGAANPSDSNARTKPK